MLGRGAAAVPLLRPPPPGPLLAPDQVRFLLDQQCEQRTHSAHLCTFLQRAVQACATTASVSGPRHHTFPSAAVPSSLAAPPETGMNGDRQVEG